MENQIQEENSELSKHKSTIVEEVQQIESSISSSKKSVKSQQLDKKSKNTLNKKGIAK